MGTQGSQAFLIDTAPGKAVVLIRDTNPVIFATKHPGQGSHSQFRPVILFGKMCRNNVLQTRCIKLSQKCSRRLILQMTQAPRYPPFQGRRVIRLFEQITIMVALKH